MVTQRKMSSPEHEAWRTKYNIARLTVIAQDAMRQSQAAETPPSGKKNFMAQCTAFNRYTDDQCERNEEGHAHLKHTAKGAGRKRIYWSTATPEEPKHTECPAIHPLTKEKCQIELENHVPSGQEVWHYARADVLFNHKDDIYWTTPEVKEAPEETWTPCPPLHTEKETMSDSIKVLDTLTGRVLKRVDLLPTQLYTIGPDGSNYRYLPYQYPAKKPAATTVCPEIHPQSQKQCQTPLKEHVDLTLHYAVVGPEQATYWRTDLVQAIPTEEGAVFEAELIGKVGVRQFMVTSSKGRIVYIDTTGRFYWDAPIKVGTVKILLP